jgi:hypothetical protein
MAVAPLDSKKSIAKLLSAADGSLTLASTSELEGNTSAHEWLRLGQAQLRACAEVIERGTVRASAVEIAQLALLVRRAELIAARA